MAMLTLRENRYVSITQGRMNHSREHGAHNYGFGVRARHQMPTLLAPEFFNNLAIV